MLIGIFSQLQEVFILWSVQVVTSAASVPACAQRPSARLGLHIFSWTGGTSILRWRIIALSPPLLSARAASRPGAPAAPATIHLLFCTDNFPGEEEVRYISSLDSMEGGLPIALEWSAILP